MSDDGPVDALDTLRQARAQLEVVLRENAHWRDLGRATQPANRAALERALAGNAVFRAWELLGRVIGGMHPSVAAVAPLPALAEAPARHPRMELRQVLERIRTDSPFDTAEAPVGAVAATDDAPGMAPAGRPAIAPADIQIEEATVSFIVREAVRPGASTDGPEMSPPAEAVTPQAGSFPPTSAPGSEPGDDDDTEVEVTIVRRSR